MLQNRYRRPRGRDDEPSEVDTKRISRDETSDTRRRTTAEDESRMTIAERLRKKNQELIYSSDRTDKSNERSSDRSSTSDRFSSSRDKENVPSTGFRTRTSVTSATDAGDSKDVQRKLDQALKDLKEYKQKYEKVLEEKEELEKQMEQYKEDIGKMQELKNDNLRLKDENGALIRVISKLSRTPSS